MHFSKFSTDFADNNLIYSSIIDEEIWDIHWIAATNNIVLYDENYFIYNSNFVHRFCLCTMKIQYLADIQLSKSPFGVLCPLKLFLVEEGVDATGLAPL